MCVNEIAIASVCVSCIWLLPLGAVRAKESQMVAVCPPLFFWRLHFLRYFLIPEFKQVVGCVENWSRVFRSLLFYAAPFPLFPLPALVAILNRLFDTLSPAFSNIFNSPRYSLFRRFPSATS